MKELIIELAEISSKYFYGEGNKHIDLLKKYFSELKIVARGSQIKAYGSEQSLKKFDTIIVRLLSVYKKKKLISTEEFEQILDPSHRMEINKEEKDVILYKTSGKPVKMQNASQRKFVRLVKDNDMVFSLGPAGTGKTYVSVAMAVKALKEKRVRRIVLTRPAVEAGENLGFLPGDIRDKLDPYMQPLYDALVDMIPAKKLENYLENRTIEIAPLAFMRGRTLDDAFVILDEAQNTTHQQMKMFLTRMGKSAKFIITGDPGQVDLPGKTISGLREAVTTLKDIKGVAILKLTELDVVRHHLVKEIVKAYALIQKR